MWWKQISTNDFRLKSNVKQFTAKVRHTFSLQLKAGVLLLIRSLFQWKKDSNNCVFRQSLVQQDIIEWQETELSSEVRKCLWNTEWLHTWN